MLGLSGSNIFGTGDTGVTPQTPVVPQPAMTPMVPQITPARPPNPFDNLTPVQKFNMISPHPLPVGLAQGMGHMGNKLSALGRTLLASGITQ
jgi:hypothetical protein